MANHLLLAADFIDSVSWIMLNNAKIARGKEEIIVVAIRMKGLQVY